MSAPEDLSACAAEPYRGLVGQNEDRLETTLILAPVRVIRPGTVVNWPPLTSRINFEISEDGQVTRIFCG
ncbi:I78 family peptidase inhibitor [Aestuariibius insulae]|uniref:I78 family peptidase inhibitor n=1 Tax=Aestuariibius insulae TaxID=2058287 RepID=UPI00345EFA6A